MQTKHRGKQKGVPHLPAMGRRLKLETALPEIIEQKLSVKSAAQLAGVDPRTAKTFMLEKCKDFALENRSKFFGFAPRHAAVFNKAAERQIDTLEALNDKPRERWTAEDFKLERHALNCIKSIHPFLALAAAAAPVTYEPLKGGKGVGESPSDDDDEEEITGDDGV